MDKLWRITSILLILSGALCLVFGVIAALGVVMGGALVTGGVPSSPGGPSLDQLGPMILGLYLFLFISALFGGVTHLIGGIQGLRGRRSGLAMWLACIGTLGTVGTVYCALTGLVPGIMLLVALLEPFRHGQDEPA